MTPLAWSAPAEKINQFREMKSAQLTVDVDVLIGTK
jgi:23S rRNA (guanine745-N1)-methyltransferase